MQASKSGDTLITVVGPLTRAAAEDMQAALELLHEEIDGL